MRIGTLLNLKIKDCELRHNIETKRDYYMIHIKKEYTKSKRNRDLPLLLNETNDLLSVYLKAIQLLIPKDLRNTIFINTTIGEKHRWMYDNYSLSMLLKKYGFRNISIEKYDTSKIYKFNDYFLDIKTILTTQDMLA